MIRIFFYCQKPIRLILFFTFCIIFFPTFLSASVEKEQFPVSFTCKKVDSLIQEAIKFKTSDIRQYRYLSNQALTIAKGLLCKSQEALALLHVGSCYFYEENFYNALVYYFESNDLFQEVKEFDGCISALSLIVNCYLQIDDKKRALEYLQKMEKLLLNASYIISYGRVYYYWAQYYYQTNKLNEAETASYIALYYFSKAYAGSEVARTLKILGDIKLNKGDLTRSIYFYQIAIYKSTMLGDFGEVGVLYTRISHVNQLLQNYNEVLEYNIKALRIREKQGTVELLASSYINIGGTYLKLDKYDSAKYFLEKGIALAKPGNKSFLLEHAYQELYAFHMEMGNQKEALQNYIQYIDYHRKLIEDQNNNEIKKLEASRKIREVEIRTELLKKENEVQRLQYHNRRLQTILLEISFLFAISIVFFIYVLRKKTIKSRLELLALNNQLKLDIEERIRAETKLRESEELYRFLAEHSVDVISHIDNNLHRKYISPSCKNLFGYEFHELLNQNPFNIIDPQDHESVRATLKSMIRSKKPGHLTYRVIRKDGKKIWIETNVNPIFDPQTGELKEFLSVLRNISERKYHEVAIAENARQKEILLREIHHRVKNNFAVLISLMDIQKEIDHEKILNQSLTDLQLRVRTMSLVHEQLYFTDNIRKVQLGQYLLTLVNIISNAYEKNNITLNTNIKECLTDIELALPLGLIVNELLTNAFKYAFPGNMSGNIQVTLQPSTDKEKDQIPEETLWKLTVSDDGIGLPEFFTMDPKSGMGSQIIRILVNQIEAQLEIENRQGASFNLIFSNVPEPLSRTS